MIDLQTLTKAERLETSRRRAGLTQREAADLLGWPFSTYKRGEKGGLEIQSAYASPRIGELTGAEECRLMRRRAGLTHKELEVETGLRAKWLHRAERGETSTLEPLLEFWRRRVGA
jgi:transcriptional regulator with XRE-family HTH domain